MKTYLAYSLAFLWLWSGIQPILFAPEWSLHLLAQVGIPPDWQKSVFYFSSCLDVVLAIAYLTQLKNKPLFYLFQFATVLAYSVIIAFRLPEMWLHPFAPLIKNMPILAILFFLFQQKKQELKK
ncbi:DoxX-like family protein [Alysiella crassa]|uniref:DoxX-like family protein n=1 Tax=Alysiella crassa TaxID=153491 RepID=A0A376BVU4_9NEIS|nr:DoxX-like family protein [Alysiella crassa]UOP06573.1 DoxX-like family protein [Alysiella crassa]SSY81107.1 Uncharacterised protein [Alysiella crassa]